MSGYLARRCPVFLTLAALLLLAACGNTTATQAYLHRSGVPNSFVYAAGGRDMAVVVVGNPFPVPKGDLDRFVADSMQGRNHGPRTHFSAMPGESARPGYRIVVVLNPSLSFSAPDACGNPAAIPSGASAARLRVLMVFCAKDTILSEVTGSVPAMALPQDGLFRDLIGAMTWELVPNDDTDTDENEPLLVRNVGRTTNMGG